jgi:hypothetical protein
MAKAKQTKEPKRAAKKTVRYPPTGRTSRDRDCPDFTSQAEAQQFFIDNGGPSRDPHRLDRDKDGIACENN